MHRITCMTVSEMSVYRLQLVLPEIEFRGINFAEKRMENALATFTIAWGGNPLKSNNVSCRGEREKERYCTDSTSEYEIFTLFFLVSIIELVSIRFHCILPFWIKAEQHLIFFSQPNAEKAHFRWRKTIWASFFYGTVTFLFAVKSTNRSVEPDLILRNFTPWMIRVTKKCTAGAYEPK